MEPTLVPSVSSASHFENQDILTCNAFKFRPKHNATLVSGPVHPPWFGATFTHLFSQSWNCHFDSIDDDGSEPASEALPLYVEKVTFATDLPFQVTVASLILLQRLYTRLPEPVYDSRSHLSPQRLFTAAYILSAKQHAQLALGLDLNQVLSAADEPVDLNETMTPLSDTYWTRITSYSVNEVKTMQRELVASLGRNIAILPQPDPESERALQALDPFPTLRGLPELDDPDILEYAVESDADLERLLRKVQLNTVPNFGRVHADEQLKMFREMGEALSAVHGLGENARESAWWK